MRKLSLKKAAFVREFLVDHNAAQAAIRAGYSARTARQIGSNLLSTVNVAEAVKAAMSNLEVRAGVESMDIISGLKFEAHRTGKGASHSARVQAWTQLGRHLGMFTDRVEHSGTVDMAARILEGRRRAAIS